MAKATTNPPHTQAPRADEVTRKHSQPSTLHRARALPKRRIRIVQNRAAVKRITLAQRQARSDEEPMQQTPLLSQHSSTERLRSIASPTSVLCRSLVTGSGRLWQWMNSCPTHMYVWPAIFRFPNSGHTVRCFQSSCLAWPRHTTPAIACVSVCRHMVEKAFPVFKRPPWFWIGDKPQCTVHF